MAGRRSLSLPDFTENRISGELVYDGGFIRVEKDRVQMPNGASASRCVVRHCGAVAIIPVFANGDILLVHQYRYALGRHILEIPAGKLERDEAPLDCAKRELSEETGYMAKHWGKWLDTHSSVGFTDEKLDVFLASDISFGGQQQGDEDEYTHAVRLTLEDALARLAEGQITENRTQLALLWLRLRQAGISIV